MKKILSLFIVLSLALCAVALAEADAPLGQAMPDFTFTSCEGEDISLSALLAEKDLVVVNIFASWCPPCRAEFPEMQSVYEEMSDRVEIVALSGDPDDTNDIVSDYKAEMGLTFPMGREEGTGIADFINLEAYPTTIVIDKSGVVGFKQVGMFANAASFKGVLDYFLNDAYDGAPAAAYNVYVCDQDEHPVPGAVISFCTDETCLPMTSADDGTISFTDKPASYHLQVLKLPEGCSIDEGFEATCEGDGEWVIVQVNRDPSCICD